MISNQLIELIGEQEYLNAIDSIRIGKSTSVDFAHDIQYHFETLKFDETTIWQTWKELVYELPTYSIWMYVNMFYSNQATEEQKNELNKILSDLLESGSPQQIEAVKYALWVDFFEDPKTVEGCWTYLERTIKTDLAKRHLMEISGPVPYYLKKTYYEFFLGTHDQRVQLQTGLTRSCTDVFGAIDVDEALKLAEEIEKLDAEIDLADLKVLLRSKT